MDTFWTSIRGMLGTLAAAGLLIILGIGIERFLNTPSPGLQVPAPTYVAPIKCVHYVMPPGYLDILVITLADGTQVATTGTALLQLQPPDLRPPVIPPAKPE